MIRSVVMFIELRFVQRSVITPEHEKNGQAVFTLGQVT
jgi:hypothetical protein